MFKKLKKSPKTDEQAHEIIVNLDPVLYLATQRVTLDAAAQQLLDAF